MWWRQKSSLFLVPSWVCFSLLILLLSWLSIPSRVSSKSPAEDTEPLSGRAVLSATVFHPLSQHSILIPKYVWTSPFEMRESAFPQPCQSWALCSFKNLCHWSSKNKNLILLIDVSLIAAEVKYIHIWISFFLVELLFHVPYPPCFGEWFL